MGDKRAAAVLLLLAAAGLLVRFWGLGAGAPGAVAYRAAGGGDSRDSVAARSLRLARPLGRGEKVDLDRAPAEELARLPRIGPALSARIVADREAKGPFGSLEELDRVPGIGPSTLEALRPHAAFSGRPEPRSVLLAPAPAASAAPAAPPASAAGGSGGRRQQKVSLNTASEADLAHLPGIGPTRARAIVADRKANGPYRSLEDLRRVPGIGAGTLERLRGRVIVP